VTDEQKKQLMTWRGRAAEAGMFVSLLVWFSGYPHAPAGPILFALGLPGLFGGLLVACRRYKPLCGVVVGACLNFTAIIVNGGMPVVARHVKPDALHHAVRHEDRWPWLWDRFFGIWSAADFLIIACLLLTLGLWLRSRPWASKDSLYDLGAEVAGGASAGDQSGSVTSVDLTQLPLRPDGISPSAPIYDCDSDFALPQPAYRFEGVR
jgi:hypothetical protein